jgi:hypothetical protein
MANIVGGQGSACSAGTERLVDIRYVSMDEASMGRTSLISGKSSLMSGRNILSVRLIMSLINPASPSLQ